MRRLVRGVARVRGSAIVVAVFVTGGLGCGRGCDGCGRCDWSRSQATATTAQTQAAESESAAAPESDHESWDRDGQQAAAGDRATAIRGYVPGTFPPGFRERIVGDFAAHVDERLGAEALTTAQREAIASAQRAFWDEHGPNVDAFAGGSITQLELAERTRAAMRHFSERMAAALTDAEYRALLDAEKGDDLHDLLFHSADEQPGLAMPPPE